MARGARRSNGCSRAYRTPGGAGGEGSRPGAPPLAERLRPRIAAETVFKSFPAYYGAALGAILRDAPEPREIAIETARHLARRLYSPTLKLVPLGTQAEEGGHIGNTETSIDSLQAAPALFWAASATGDAGLRDRKSTRLNSSPGYRSHAVS